MYISKKKFGDFFDYSLVNYTNCKMKIKLKYIKHNNIFEVTPDAHLNNNSKEVSGGCKICHKENIKKIFIKDKEKFINELNTKYLIYLIIVKLYIMDAKRNLN